MISIRLATRNDLADIVAVHRRAFDGSFLTRLGPRFLQEYYGAVCDYELGIALVASLTGADVAGFATGLVDPSAFYRRLRTRRFRLPAAMLPALLRRPSLLHAILANSRRVTSACREDTVCRQSELASIAVCPDLQGRGVGKELVRAFLQHSEKKGCNRVCLTTDAGGNDRVNEFYRGMGFQVVDTLDQGGKRPMHRYILHFEA